MIGTSGRVALKTFVSLLFVLLLAACGQPSPEAEAEYEARQAEYAAAPTTTVEVISTDDYLSHIRIDGIECIREYYVGSGVALSCNWNDR